MNECDLAVIVRIIFQGLNTHMIRICG